MGGNGGGIVPICPSLCMHRDGTSGGVCCCLSGWQADWLACLLEVPGWLGEWWVSLVSHLCYDLHGCQSQWQLDKFLAEQEVFSLFI